MKRDWFSWLHMKTDLIVIQCMCYQDWRQMDVHGAAGRKGGFSSSVGEVERGETWVDEGVTMAFIPKKRLQENTTEIFLVSDLFSFWFIFPHQCFMITLSIRLFLHL